MNTKATWKLQIWAIAMQQQCNNPNFSVLLFCILFLFLPFLCLVSRQLSGCPLRTELFPVYLHISMLRWRCHQFSIGWTLLAKSKTQAADSNKCPKSKCFFIPVQVLLVPLGFYTPTNVWLSSSCLSFSHPILWRIIFLYII